MTIPQLVAIGDNCLDVYLTKGFMTVGGNALNVAVHWHNSGRAARYLGAVGDDEAGRIVLAEIAAAGLPAADVEIRDGDTAVTLLADRLGDRTFLLEAFGVGEDFLPEPRHEASIAAADWVHLGTNANRDLVRRLAADGVRFSVDVSTAHDTLPLEGVALVFASGPDDAAMPVAPILSRLRAAGARQIVLTRGASGCGLRRWRRADLCGGGAGRRRRHLRRRRQFHRRLHRCLLLRWRRRGGGTRTRCVRCGRDLPPSRRICAGAPAHPRLVAREAPGGRCQGGRDLTASSSAQDGVRPPSKSAGSVLHTRMPHHAVRRPLVLAAIMIAMFMIAIEATIVSTVMPKNRRRTRWAASL